MTRNYRQNMYAGKTGGYCEPQVTNNLVTRRRYQNLVEAAYDSSCPACRARAMSTLSKMKNLSFDLNRELFDQPFTAYAAKKHAEAQACKLQFLAELDGGAYNTRPDRDFQCAHDLYKDDAARLQVHPVNAQASAQTRNALVFDMYKNLRGLRELDRQNRVLLAKHTYDFHHTDAPSMQQILGADWPEYQKNDQARTALFSSLWHVDEPEVQNFAEGFLQQADGDSDAAFRARLERSFPALIRSLQDKATSQLGNVCDLGCAYTAKDRRAARRPNCDRKNGNKDNLDFMDNLFATGAGDLYLSQWEKDAALIRPSKVAGKQLAGQSLPGLWCYMDSMYGSGRSLAKADMQVNMLALSAALTVASGGAAAPTLAATTAAAETVEVAAGSLEAGAQACRASMMLKSVTGGVNMAMGLGDVAHALRTQCNGTNWETSEAKICAARGHYNDPQFAYKAMERESLDRSCALGVIGGLLQTAGGVAEIFGAVKAAKNYEEFDRALREAKASAAQGASHLGEGAGDAHQPATATAAGTQSRNTANLAHEASTNPSARGSLKANEVAEKLNGREIKLKNGKVGYIRAEAQGGGSSIKVEVYDHSPDQLGHAQGNRLYMGSREIANGHYGNGSFGSMEETYVQGAARMIESQTESVLVKHGLAGGKIIPEISAEEGSVVRFQIQNAKGENIGVVAPNGKGWKFVRDTTAKPGADMDLGGGFAGAVGSAGENALKNPAVRQNLAKAKLVAGTSNQGVATAVYGQYLQAAPEGTLLSLKATNKETVDFLRRTYEEGLALASKKGIADVPGQTEFVKKWVMARIPASKWGRIFSAAAIRDAGGKIVKEWEVIDVDFNKLESAFEIKFRVRGTGQ